LKTVERDDTLNDGVFREGAVELIERTVVAAFPPDEAAIPVANLD
jgi:hypothetical protein